MEIGPAGDQTEMDVGAHQGVADEDPVGIAERSVEALKVLSAGSVVELEAAVDETAANVDEDSRDDDATCAGHDAACRPLA
jgi:hypothetical protein